jgi:hypothetical protein
LKKILVLTLKVIPKEKVSLLKKIILWRKDKTI